MCGVFWRFRWRDWGCRIHENVKVCLMCDLDYILHWHLERTRCRGQADGGFFHSSRTASSSSTFVCMDKAARVGVQSLLPIILRIRSSYVPVLIDCTFGLLLLKWLLAPQGCACTATLVKPSSPLKSSS